MHVFWFPSYRGGASRHCGAMQVPESVLVQIGPDYGQQCVESLELATPLLIREEDAVWSLRDPASMYSPDDACRHGAFKRIETCASLVCCCHSV